MVLGVTYVLLEQGLLGDSKIYPSTGNPYEFKGAILSIFPGTFLMGILFGIAEVFLLDRIFTKRSFGEKIAYKVVIYLTAFICFICTMSLLSHAYQLSLPIFHPEVLAFVKLFISNFAFWSMIIYSSVGMVMMLFISEVSNNLGPKVLLNFFKGKYHKPRVEERIFMFLDMKSSTTIAEKLGHVEYFNLLNEYYADITDPIINSYGEIYQYVGDEVIVTWEMKDNQEAEKAIKCFYSIKKEIQTKADNYKNKYGLLPEFKAGIHGGQVSTGEIGTVKRDIVFSGDVLNTTARIQALCNTYASDLLVSNWLKRQIEESSDLSIEEIGSIELRGKTENVILYSINKGE